ncbi:hypothetical protein GCM10009765_11300 [Fodinicola feengrottensis]|uniref:S8 family serine peptidase n=1 Tax=Fodinicola feengrottensis TaxID=435914 RepID=A0ABN2G1R7_9ACTN
MTAATALSGPATAAGAQPLTAAEVSALTIAPGNASTSVIVLLRNQPGAAARGSAAALSRAQAIAGNQAPLVSELTQVHAKNLRRYQLINAVAATVSAAEATRLAANPNVAQVLPDRLLKVAQPAKTPSRKAGSASGTVPAGTCAPAGQTQLEPEGLSTTNTDSADPAAKTARSLGFTGAGVKVGFIAEGIDVNNPDFIRADGSKVFANFQDFSGEGAAAPNVDSESFLDASAIAAQGRQVYDVQNFSADPLPSTCDIRVEGVSPGVSLFGYKVLGTNAEFSEANYIQAIDYAVTTDHVDVLNESVVFQPVPDVAALNAVEQANDAAVREGVTIVGATGDAGTNSTIDVPSTDPNIISVGASTDFRWQEQTNYTGARQFSTGWLNNNVSAITSAGFTQSGRTLDLLAPGDGSFAVCTPNLAIYLDCADFTGKASSVVRSGGTSAAAPFVSGTAALVIQAYRKGHGGASPTPAQIKQIVTSTAQDLTAPSNEQGAGQVDAYRAVQAAQGNTGSSVLVDQSQLNSVGAPGGKQNFTVHVTNTGASTQTVNLSGRTFGTPRTVGTGTVTLSDSASDHFTDWNGTNDNFGKFTFTVPAGVQRLKGSIAFQSAANAGGNGRVRLDLIDPTGKLAANSIPQAIGPDGNYGSADVVLPAAGIWTAVMFSAVSTSGGTVGPVKFQADVANTAAFGAVSPATMTLAPGASRAATVTETTPAGAGDSSGALVVNGSGGQHSSLPIIMRGLVQPTSGGAFTGTLTGGNNFNSDDGQANYYQFDVPAGVSNLKASVKLTNDPGDTVETQLVAPSGYAVGSGSNQLTTAYNPTTRVGTFSPQLGTDAYARAPQAGRWTLVIRFPGNVVGDEVSQPFTGSVTFNTVKVDGSAVRTATKRPLAAKNPVGITVPVTNTGTQPMNFFLDPRLNTTSTLTLAPVEPQTNFQSPLNSSESSPAWLVPTESSQFTVTATASAPIGLNYGPESGDPVTLSTTNGTTATGSITGSPLPNGVWAANVVQIGPFAAPTTTTANLSATVRAAPFDANVVPDATDFWQTSVTPATSMHLVTVLPGQTVTLTANITPTGPSGTTVSGTVYVDSLVVGSTSTESGFEYNDSGSTEPAGDELAAIPYSYTIS